MQFCAGIYHRTYCGTIFSLNLVYHTIDTDISFPLILRDIFLLFQLIHLASEQDNEVNQEQILQFISESSFEEGIMRGSCIHLSRFCCEYADYLAQLRRQVSRGVLVEIEKEIRENYADNLSLRELSKKYFVNRSYLGQIFRKQYGQSFKDYLCEYRINEAAQELLKTDKKISQIAEDV